MNQISDINILSYEHLPTPREIKSETPLSEQVQSLVTYGRKSFENILKGKDTRTALIVGPCSIHDTEAGLEYAKKISELSKKVEDKFLILMRVYFTKPRTTTGWKGLINDPKLNDSFSIADGLRTARSFLLQVLEEGIPTATEALDAIIPQYIDDLISWNAIGARTTESQTHREMASGLSTPVGFKNGTDGNFFVAINAMKSAETPHHFLGIDNDGRCAVLHTKGNPLTHIVLRGGTTPNYDQATIENITSFLTKADLNNKIVVDCSHGNSQKDYKKQEVVWNDCINQIAQGNSSIMGIMLESNLKEGRQDIGTDQPLQYGVSVTDACIGWETTESLVLDAYKKLK